MRRREFIAGLGGAAVWPLAVQAQGKAPTIGFLGALSPSATSHLLAAFVQRLRELGWIDGRTVTIEYRWADGRTERFAEIAAEFVRLKVDVIFAHTTPPVLVAKQATSVVPIVFVAGDPVGTGVVASLARPGGNVTGLSSQATDTASKRLALLREVVPGLRRLAIIGNVSNRFTVLEVSEVQSAAQTFGLGVLTLEILRPEDIGPAFDSINDRADALYICVDPLVTTNRTRISTLALGVRLPSMSAFREYVEAGALMSYGANNPDLFRRAADLANKILRGAKPAEIPVEQPTRFDLTINLTTAKTLGLTIPETLLATADEQPTRFDLTINLTTAKTLGLTIPETLLATADEVIQ